MLEVQTDYEELKQTSDNIGDKVDNKVEQKTPWEERVDKNAEDAFRRVFNKLGIHSSFDQGN